jgi:hypothetical protein
LLLLQRLADIDLHEGRLGLGTLVFARDVLEVSRGVFSSSRILYRDRAPAFDGIADAAAVLRLIRNAQAALLERPAAAASAG